MFFKRVDSMILFVLFSHSKSNQYQLVLVTFLFFGGSLTLKACLLYFRSNLNLRVYFISFIIYYRFTSCIRKVVQKPMNPRKSCLCQSTSWKRWTRKVIFFSSQITWHQWDSCFCCFILFIYKIRMPLQTENAF